MSFACHDKYQQAERALGIMRRPALNRASDREEVRSILTKTDWPAASCGEFDRWWFAELYQHLEWAASNLDQTVLDALVSTWFKVSCHMLTVPGAYCPFNDSLTRLQQCGELDDTTRAIASNLQRYCVRFERLQLSDWAKAFQAGLEGSPRIAASLTAHFGDFIAHFQTDIVVLQCIRSIARQAHADRELRLRFFGLAQAFVKAFPHFAHELVDDVLEVASRDLVTLLPLAGSFFLQITHRDRALSEVLLRAHERIHEWIEAAEDREAVATMRRAQEKFAPHLQMRRPRRTHRMGGSVLKVTVFPPGGQDHIEGTVADITLGRGTDGRGVRIVAPGWWLTTGRHLGEQSCGDSKLFLNAIKARRLPDGEEFEFQDPNVEVRWGAKRVRGKALSIRALPHADGGRNGSFCVLFLLSGDAAFEEWQAYVRELPEVDYGASGGPS
jgi:hypothetical protein